MGIRNLFNKWLNAEESEVRNDPMRYDVDEYFDYDDDDDYDYDYCDYDDE